MAELTPDTITAVPLPPAAPAVAAPPPAPAAAIVVPVPGVRGPQGNPGPSGSSPEALADTINAFLEAHRNEPMPHKAYDLDMPSLDLLFENGLA